MEFAKLEGSGNDFIVIDNRDSKVERFLNRRGLSMEEFVIKMCTPHTGVGGDGLILIEEPQSKENHFRWRFFNPDGSVAEMCGNGSRCAVRFAYQMGICPESARFETLVGVIHAEVKEGGKRVKVRLTKPYGFQEKPLEVKGRFFEGNFINTGVPHYVVMIEDLENLDVVRYGRAIRFHSEFEPNGTNVNFIKGVDENTIKVRTYERGVEGETLACGTGAVASAIVSYRKGIVKTKPVNVITKGGEILSVDFDEDLSHAYLEGNIYWVFDGYLRELR